MAYPAPETEQHVIDKYQLIAQLGQGGMATVYLACLDGPFGLQKLVVIKALRQDISDERDSLCQMFLDEARLSAKMLHPNVVQTIEAGQSDGRMFLVMEYLEGQPLSTLLRRTTQCPEFWPLSAHVRVLTEMLRGLHYAHELAGFDGKPLGVVHRDVSPHNVFVTYDGVVKLTDFGIAKVAAADSQTQAGVLKGKVSYMAPEQVAGIPVDRRADIFAAGVILFEALCGRRFWHGQSETSIFRHLLTGTLPDVHAAAPSTPEPLRALCAKALAVDPNDRFSTAAEFQCELEHWLELSARGTTPIQLGRIVAPLFRHERDDVRQAIPILIVGALPLACTAILNLDVDQCHSDDGCRALAAGASCDLTRRVCVYLPTARAPTAPDAGSGVIGGGADAYGEAEQHAETGPDGGECDDPTGLQGMGCYRCSATTREHFLNACTAAQCVRFDESTRLGAYVGESGTMPGLPSEAVGTALDASTATQRQDTGPDADRTAAPEAASLSSGAHACAGLPNPVYVSGSSAIKPFLATAALALGHSNGTGRTTIVYQSQGSCAGVDAMVNGTPIAGTASYWDPEESDSAEPERTCELDTAGAVVDLGVSDVFATSCFSLPQGLPVSLMDSLGPVQAMAFVVPASSSQQVISAEAAYRVYGFGAGSGVAPWTIENTIFRRTASSGTQSLLAALIGLPADRWRGTAHATSEGIVQAIRDASADSTLAEHTIGILGGAYLNVSAAPVRTLGFQDRRQVCAFWPDSAPAARDKRNVRDGHYPLWGPLHLLTRTLPDGRPANAAAASVASYLAGAVPLPDGTTLLSLYAKNGLVPMCAMHVSRASDGGPLHAYDAPQPCGCYFDEVAMGATECRVCTGPSECPANHPQCSYGYCE